MEKLKPQQAQKLLSHNHLTYLGNIVMWEINLCYSLPGFFLHFAHCCVFLTIFIFLQVMAALEADRQAMEKQFTIVQVCFTMIDIKKDTRM